MNRCLCCGKPFTEKSTEQEKKNQWHDRCIRRFFGVGILPELDFTDATLMRIAAESTSKGYTVPGVQKKMSLHLTADRRTPRLTIVNYPTGYILKPQTEQYEALPEAEYLAMQMAEKTGIETVPYALIKMAGNSGDTAYITKRVDRVFTGKNLSQVELLAMEDFCQLERRQTEDKYLGSYERCAKVISRFSARPVLDLSELFLRIVFSFVIGNSDMHLKNFSLIETSAGNEEYVLSPAYDMLPVNLLVPEDPEQMALSINGKKRNIRRNDFLKFAETAGVPQNAAVKLMERVCSLSGTYIKMCEESYLPDHLKEGLGKIIEERSSVLRR